MSKLANGNYRCPACKTECAPEDMYPDRIYCKPCKRARNTAAHRRASIAKGKKLRTGPPADFAERAGKVSDQLLADQLGVSAETVGNWRARLGIRPYRKTMPVPSDIAAVYANMTSRELGRHYGVHQETARLWVIRAGLTPRRTGRRDRPAPADWAEQCARLRSHELRKHYRAGQAAITRWSAETGVRPLRERRRRLMAAMGDALKPAQKPLPKPGKAPPKPAPRSVKDTPLNRVTSRSIVQHLARNAAATPVVRVSGCPDCTRDRPCRTHLVAQVSADVEAWLAAGNRPVEVPIGQSWVRW